MQAHTCLWWGLAMPGWTYLAFPTLLTTGFDCFEAISTHGRISRLSSKDTNAASSPAGSAWSCAGWNTPASQLLLFLICSLHLSQVLLFPWTLSLGCLHLLPDAAGSWFKSLTHQKCHPVIENKPLEKTEKEKKPKKPPKLSSAALGLSHSMLSALETTCGSCWV